MLVYRSGKMVKPKRATARQRVEKKIEKEQNQLPDQSLTKKKPEDVATIVSTAKTKPWDVRSDVFKNIEVGSAIIKDRLDNFDDVDTRTVITSKSFRGLNVRKKDKRKIKHNLFKQKIHLIQEAKQALKAKKKREKTVIVGDMKPIEDSLPTILPSVEDYVTNNTTAKRNALANAEKPTNKSKQRKKQQLNDINIFQQVLKHPEYKKNPTSTIQEHLNNRLIVEQQSMDTD